MSHNVSCRCAVLVIAGTALLMAPLPAAAQVLVGITSIIGNNDADPQDARAMEASLRGSLAQAIEAAQDAVSCDITAIELSEEFLEARETEMMLQREGYAPEDGLLESELVVTDLVTGAMGPDGLGGFDYVVGIIGPGGSDKGQISGSGRLDNIPQATDDLAAQIVKRLCTRQAYRFVGGGGDPIDQVVCDIDSTFTLDGALFGVELSGGLSGTYNFVRTPPGPPMWIASGTYKIELPDGPGGAGVMTTHGKGTIIVLNVGERTTEGGETFALTPAAPC